MILALDYDGTYTADPDLWLAFVRGAKQRGHAVHVVTMRYESEIYGGARAAKMDWRLMAFVDSIVFTGRKAKKPVCEERGLKIDVWIDDNPGAVLMSAEELWGTQCVEGDPHDPNFVQQPEVKA